MYLALASFAERAPAETDDFAACIGDFEGDAAAEGVDGALVLFARARNAGVDDLLDGEAFGFEFIDRPGPLVGRKADAEAVPFFRPDAAGLQILARIGAAGGAQCVARTISRRAAATA